MASKIPKTGGKGPEGRIQNNEAHGALAQRLRGDGSPVGQSRKVEVSPGAGFHSILVDWTNISTPSQPQGKKSKERIHNERENLRPPETGQWDHCLVVADSQGSGVLSKEAGIHGLRNYSQPELPLSSAPEVEADLALLDLPEVESQREGPQGITERDDGVLSPGG